MAVEAGGGGKEKFSEGEERGNDENMGMDTGMRSDGSSSGDSSWKCEAGSALWVWATLERASLGQKASKEQASCAESSES